MEVLIVVDMQRDFVSGVLGSPEAKALLSPLRRFLDGWQGKVIYTRDTHPEEYLQTREGRLLPVPHCIRGTEGWEIEPALAPREEDTVIDKPTFGSLALVDLLKAENEKTPLSRILLCGVCTDICVISNAMLLKAAFPECEVEVQASLSAGVTPERHETALAAMEACQITVVR